MQILLAQAEELDRAFFRMAHHLAYREVVESMFGWNEAEQDKIVDSEFDECNPHIINHAGTSVGTVGWQIREDHIWFGPIYIMPEFQSRGIGTSVLRQIIEMSRAQKLRLRLRTLSGNLGAKSFYERLGFSVMSATEKHWHMQFTNSESDNIA